MRIGKWHLVHQDRLAEAFGREFSNGGEHATRSIRQYIDRGHSLSSVRNLVDSMLTQMEIENLPEVRDAKR